MVGVPGRSKSCGTCRRRKKGKCDRKRPSCSQCLQKGFKCDGYGRETIFLNTTSSGKVQQYHVKCPAKDTTVPNSNPTEALACAAYEEFYLGAFWHRYLPESREFPSCAMPYTNGGWTVAVPKLYNSSPVIRRIMLAVCRTMEGQASGRERDREEGLRYYTSSLSTMAGALRNPGKVDHAVLVVAARLFSMYEVHCGHNSLDLLAQAENWRKHIQGELALIMSRPPETYASGYLHQLWVDGRLHLASCFLQMRKRAPMSDRDWMTIPWQTIPKTPKDLLVDILIATTGLLEDYDILGAQKDPNLYEALRQELVQTCWRLDAELALWVNTAHFGDANRALEVLNAPFSIDVLAAAHIMSIYWCACIVTYSTLRDLLSPSEIARLPPYTDPRTYFRSIADVVTVMLHPSSGIFGAQLTYFPAVIVMAYIRPVGGGDEAEAIIFNAYRRAGKDEIVESFLTSLREQEMSRSSGTLGLAPLK